MIAILGWFVLLVSLFVRAARRPARAAAQMFVPALIAIAYVLLIFEGMGAEGGGFGSIEEVRALFADDSALAAGWLHYMAFDLFVGAWIVRDALEAGVPRLLLIPCLALTFLFGPSGLLLYLVLRLAFPARAPRENLQ
ncbi:MAG: ABA4-like family protein [Pseudomonadota bacterium]|nr:ABA4-like family protein [Pseudomonadota bacterium]